MNPYLSRDKSAASLSTVPLLKVCGRWPQREKWLSNGSEVYSGGKAGPMAPLFADGIHLAQPILPAHSTVITNLFSV